jgi:hypothetical protein
MIFVEKVYPSFMTMKNQQYKKSLIGYSIFLAFFDYNKWQFKWSCYWKIIILLFVVRFRIRGIVFWLGIVGL